MEIEKMSFVERVSNTQDRISQKYDELLALIKLQRNELIQELNAIKDKYLKEFETSKDEVERQTVIMESFTRYCQEMKEKGTACDISRSGDDLHARAEELVEGQDECRACMLSRVEITLTISEVTKDGVKNFIGELLVKGLFDFLLSNIGLEAN